MQENHTPSTGSDAVKPILDKQHEFHPMNAGLGKLQGASSQAPPPDLQPKKGPPHHPGSSPVESESPHHRVPMVPQPSKE
jgi:hypothetical protein